MSYNRIEEKIRAAVDQKIRSEAKVVAEKVIAQAVRKFNQDIKDKLDSEIDTILDEVLNEKKTKK